MTEADTERSRVGRTLDSLRDSLFGFVDDAMTNAFGPTWNEVVAQQDAKRYSTPRARTVSKRDLAELLKALIFQRIPPWADPSSRSDRRIGAYASEILTLRNLHAHGDECINEQDRLIDTSRRLLTLLNMPIPDSLFVEAPAPLEGQIVPAGVPLSPTTDDLESALALLGERGREIGSLFNNAAGLLAERDQWLDSLVSEHRSPSEADVEFALGLGQRTLAAIEDSYDLEVAGQSPVESVALILVRCHLFELHPLASEAIDGRALDEVNDRLRQIEEADGSDRDYVSGVPPELARGVATLQTWMLEMGDTGSLGWREVVSRASGLAEVSPTANWVIASASIALANDLAVERSEVVSLLQDAADRLRMLAAIEPGGIWETALVAVLRRLGSALIDLGELEEAIKSFARADEVIDRYPAADPNLAAKS